MAMLRKRISSIPGAFHLKALRLAASNYHSPFNPTLVTSTHQHLGLLVQRSSPSRLRHLYLLIFRLRHPEKAKIVRTCSSTRLLLLNFWVGLSLNVYVPTGVSSSARLPVILVSRMCNFRLPKSSSRIPVDLWR